MKIVCVAISLLSPPARRTFTVYIFSILVKVLWVTFSTGCFVEKLTLLHINGQAKPSLECATLVHSFTFSNALLY